MNQDILQDFLDRKIVISWKHKMPLSAVRMQSGWPAAACYMTAGISVVIHHRNIPI